MRAAIDLLLCHLYHPRIPISLLLEGLTMLKRARYFVAIYVVAIAVAVLVVAPSLLQAQQTPINPDVYGQLKYRYIGPEGNRATSVAGVPGTSVRLRAAFSKARMAGSTGIPSSTRNQWRPSAR
jgi:hypothetical protein